MIRQNIKAIYCLLFILPFAVAIALKLQFSSIGMWAKAIPDIQDSSTLWGTPKAIRADEWTSLTPLMLSQARKRDALSIDNPTMGAVGGPLIASLPASHFSTIFRPFFWGFLFLPADYALSFLWQLKIAACLAGVFLLLLHLTQGRAWLSAAGSLWMYLSGHTQWWFSTPGTEELAASSFAAVAVIGLARASSNKEKVGYLLLFVVSACTFILSLYPPFQISLTYVIAGALGYYLWKENLFVSLLKNWKWLGAAVFISLAICALTLLDAKPAIDAMMQTVYPGKRRDFGGALAFERYFFGVFDPFLSEQRATPGFGWNVCEASSFFMIWPFAGILALAFSRTRKEFISFLLLLAPLVLLTIWHILGLPEIVAKALLLDHGNSQRMTVGLGLGNIILTTVYLASAKTPGRYDKTTRLLVALVAIVGFYYVAQQVNITSPQLFTRNEFLIAGILSLLVVTCLGMKRALPCFALIFGAYALPNLSVNPLTQGLGVLDEKPIMKSVRAIGKKDKFNHSWAVFDDLLAANMLKATGVNIINGIQYVPDATKFLALDPQRASEQIWNRYSHFALVRGESLEAVDFKLAAVDSTIVTLHPCHSSLKELKVKFFVFRREASATELSCLKPVARNPITPGFWIYKRM